MILASAYDSRRVSRVSRVLPGYRATLQNMDVHEPHVFEELTGERSHLASLAGGNDWPRAIG